MTQRDTAATLAWYAQHTTTAALGFNPDGQCLKICRTARGLPGGWASARVAAAATPRQHRITDLRKIRPGMVMYFDDPSDGNPFGHIVTVDAVPARGALSLSEITVWSNSVKPGRVVKVTADYFGRHWGDPFQFAATWLNGEPLNLTPASAPKPAPKPPKKVRKPLRSVHASGRKVGKPDGVTVAAFAAYLARLAVVEKAHLIRTTETSGKAILDEVRRVLGPGWLVEQSGEYLFAARRTVLEARPSLARLYRLTAVPGLTDWRNFRIVARGYTYRASGRKVRAMVGHAPSGVEMGRRWRTEHPRQVAAAKAGFARWGRMIAAGADDVVQDASMDANLDQRLDVWRTYLERELGAPSIWRYRDPTTGTHGARVIDTAHVLGAEVYGARVSKVPRPKGLDHKAIVHTYDMAA